MDTADLLYDMQLIRVTKGSNYFVRMSQGYINMFPEIAPYNLPEAMLFQGGFNFYGLICGVGGPLLNVVGAPKDPMMLAAWNASLDSDSRFVKHLGELLYASNYPELNNQELRTGLHYLGGCWERDDTDFMVRYNFEIKIHPYVGNSDRDYINYITYLSDIQWINVTFNSVVNRFYNGTGDWNATGLMIELIKRSFIHIWQRFFDWYYDYIVNKEKSENFSKAIVMTIFKNNALIHEEVLLQYGEHSPYLNTPGYIAGVKKYSQLLREEVDRINFD